MTPNELISELRSAIEAQQYPEIMNPKQAADFLGVSSYTLLDFRQRGAGPTFSQPTPKIVRYTREDLRAWVDENRVAAK